MYAIIPDIHGQAEKLRSLLTNLGYTDRGGAWRHSDPNRKCIFLGDYIDRGPENGAIIEIVRRMIEADTAYAIMGNHELNAIHYHSENPTDGTPLRARTEKNKHQHASFLREFPVGSSATMEAIAWMQTLPLFLEFKEFRVVHACWNSEAIGQIIDETEDGVLSVEQFAEAADRKSRLFRATEIITKGPEADLPPGYWFLDKDGNKRTSVRVKWWASEPSSWREIAMSVPEESRLPSGGVPSSVVDVAYPPKEKPVFFGHYWLTGDLELQSPNALCLDYSAGTKGGPLIAYRFLESSSGELCLAKIVGHAGHVDRRD